MESYTDDREFWQFSDQLRLQTAGLSALSLGDSIWSPAADRRSNTVAVDTAGLLGASSFFPSPAKTSFNDAATTGGGPGLIGSGKLAFGATKADRYNNNNFNANNNNNSGGGDVMKGYFFNNSNNFSSNNGYAKNTATNSFALSNKTPGSTYGGYNNNNNNNSGDVKSYFNKSAGRPANNNNNSNHHAGGGHNKKGGGAAGEYGGGRKKQGGKNDSNSAATTDKRFKTLPASEALPRGEAVGGYIFVCNNDTMDENLRRELFGLPSRYRDSVRAITPGLPLFLYNYSTHQLHGIFEAASFGGTNIDPTAWEDKKCPGESRFPAQVRVATRKICEPLEEDAFRPILHHYDGPKFRLELSVTEALALLDIFADNDHA